MIHDCSQILTCVEINILKNTFCCIECIEYNTLNFPRVGTKKESQEQTGKTEQYILF
jgi:hypothetical protein